jgi:hypothetical protein
MKWMSWVQARLLAAVAAAMLALPAHAVLTVAANANPVAPGDVLLLQWVETEPLDDGYTDANFFFNWDPTVLDLTGASAGSAFGTSTLTQFDPGFGPGWTWFNVVRTTADPATGGELFTLQFDVLSAPASGTTFVDIYTDLIVEQTAGYYIGSPSSLGADLRVTTAVTPIPEPTTVALTLAGLGLLGVAARRRRG